MAREYKDSGVEWIGQIPKEWIVVQLKHHLSFQNGQDYKTIEAKENGGFPVYGSGGVFTFAEKYMYDGESVLFGRKGTIDRPLYVKDKFWVVDTMYYTIPKEDTSCKFLYYIATTLPYDKYSTSTALPSITQTILGNIRIALPLFDKQQKIADYLDKKCEEIDSLIEVQEQMITKLTEYKQSVITEAVTKGLNPNARLVPSGIDWIGDVPEGWKVCRIKDMVNLQSGTSLTSTEISDSGIYPVYGGNGLRGYYEDYSNDGEYILIGRQGALCGNINYASGKFWATEHAVVCYPKRAFARIWLGELLRAMNLGQYSLSSAQPGLAVERIKNLKMPLPPIAEQQTIASYLNTKYSEIDALIALKQQKIETLKDYKKSIIYEYVTGKIEIA